MKNKNLGITKTLTREEQIREVKRRLVNRLSKEGFSFREISLIIRIDAGGANRIVKHGKNSRPVTPN